MLQDLAPSCSFSNGGLDCSTWSAWINNLCLHGHVWTVCFCMFVSMAGQRRVWAGFCFTEHPLHTFTSCYCPPNLLISLLLFRDGFFHLWWSIVVQQLSEIMHNDHKLVQYRTCWWLFTFFMSKILKCWIHSAYSSESKILGRLKVQSPDLSPSCSPSLISTSFIHLHKHTNTVSPPWGLCRTSQRLSSCFLPSPWRWPWCDPPRSPKSGMSCRGCACTSMKF